MTEELQRIARQQIEADIWAGYPGETPNANPLVQMEPAERRALTEEEAGLVTAVVLSSKSGGVPHVVSRREDGTVGCTCAAMRSIETRPAGCWAMKLVRGLVGAYEP